MNRGTFAIVHVHPVLAEAVKPPRQLVMGEWGPSVGFPDRTGGETGTGLHMNTSAESRHNRKHDWLRRLSLCTRAAGLGWASTGRRVDGGFANLCQVAFAALLGRY